MENILGLMKILQFDSQCINKINQKLQKIIYYFLFQN